MTVGINVDGRYWPAAADPAQLVGCGLQGIRLLSAPGAWSYAQEVHNYNQQILAVVPDESHGYILPQATILQIGNEPDLSSPAPDHMPPAQYADLYQLYRETYPGFPMFTAGFASGNPDYWGAVYDLLLERGVQLPDAVAVHPYNKTAAQAAELLDQYWNISQIPVAVTEWFREAGQGEIWPFQDMLEFAPDARATVWNSWFCWTDAQTMHTEGTRMGLVDEHSNPTSRGYELVSALGGHF